MQFLNRTLLFMNKKKSQYNESIVMVLWAAVMLLITVSLFMRHNPNDATYVTATVVVLMWVVFLSFYCRSYLKKFKALGAPIGWWALLALMIAAQFALLHLLITTLLQGVYMGAGIAAIVLSGVFRFMLDFIRARRKASKKMASLEENQ